MRISTKVRYGAEALLDLALHHDEEPVSLKDIARRQEIPQHYLEQLVSRMKAADVVRSTRGSKGGVSLARPPREISMSDIVRIFEGSNALTECIDNPELCPRYGSCVTRDVWDEMYRAMNRVLESTTLEDLVERQRERGLPEKAMYYI